MIWLGRLARGLGFVSRRWIQAICLTWMLLMLAGSAFAQEDSLGPAMPSSKSFVYQYFLVGLCFALGIFLLCQPRNREESIESRMDLAYGD